MKVYGVTGLPGAGKSIISRIAIEEGIHIVSMGDVIREEAERQNCTTGAAAVNLRKKYGNNVVADRCVKKIIYHSRNRNRKNVVTKNYKNNKQTHQSKTYKKIQQDIYLIEGIRSPYEVSYFKRNFRNFKVIAIHSSPNTRFTRIKHRQRTDDTTDYKTFLERDNRELKFGIGDVVAHADYMLINEGPIPKFKNKVKALILNEIKPKSNSHKYRGKNNNKNKNKSNRKPNKGRKQYKKYNKSKSRNKQNRR